MNICTFRVGRWWFGLESSAIQEITRTPVLTPVPWPPKGVRGLFSYRGKLTTSFDFLTLAGLQDDPKKSADSTDWHLVSQYQSEGIAWSINEPGDVFDIKQSELEAPPPNLSQTARKILPYALPFPKALVMIVDMNSLMEQGRPHAA